jgi:predicted nucleotidyltransferase
LPSIRGRVCRLGGADQLELFGSAVRDDFRNDSDVDLLCTVRPELQCGLFGWVAFKLEFEKLFGCRVDLVSRPGIERSENPYASTRSFPLPFRLNPYCRNRRPAFRRAE